MTEHDRSTAYEAIGCAIAALERVNYRDIPVEILQAVVRARGALSAAQLDLHRLAGPLRDGGRVIGG